MKPQKKLLYSCESLNTAHELYREYPRNKIRSPIKELGDFRGRNLPDFSQEREREDEDERKSKMEMMLAQIKRERL